METKVAELELIFSNIVDDVRINNVLRLADNSLIMGHRLSEWTGHGPMLEQDIAISNIALDLIGQSRNFYQYAATLIGHNVAEDDLAYFRNAEQFKNFILTELPNGDWGKTIMKLFLFSVYQFGLYNKLKHDDDKQIAAIAEKSLKEVTYHVRWSAEWVVRLGDGTDESRQRINKALKETWPFTNEMFLHAEDLRLNWKQKVTAILEEATLELPEDDIDLLPGVHTEHLTSLLAEMQILQRTYPGCEW